MNEKITGSIVLYKNNTEKLTNSINSYLNYSVGGQLYLVDNSPTDYLKNICTDSRITYHHNPSNPGFGASHNMAMELAKIEGSKFHFIINPDVYFNQDVITPMVTFMAKNPDVGMMMPEILYPDGRVQYLPKLLPHPSWLVKRKFTHFLRQDNKLVQKYELRSFPQGEQYNSPILSGCFTLLSLKAIEEVGGYDDSFFMYFEDFDLSRRMHMKYKTLYFPQVSVYHEYESGANKSPRLFKVFLKSAVIYFNKWGWLVDRERDIINKKTLSQFKCKL
ncbi:glycosyltransferase [Rubrolithibacter danxiaensis]|uniref:glycosyltransferase n=1 Tax=Rubrolithibacter danxiaensis TaxID=3390805 RepID=UPI003BF78335